MFICKIYKEWTEVQLVNCLNSMWEELVPIKKKRFNVGLVNTFL